MISLFQDHKIPIPVIAISVSCLVLGITSLFYYLFFLPIGVIVTLACFKALLIIGAGFGLLKLSKPWKTFLLVVTGLGSLFLPLNFMAVILSSAFAQFVSDASGIESRSAIVLTIALIFGWCLWVFLTLAKPEVEGVFQS